jgi:dTDP-4-amino-4,6-dideoxygalactose transaminase
MHAWSVYTIRVDRQREALVQHLNAAGVETGIYYPITLADQPLFQTSLPCSMNIENARQAAREVLSLPIYPGMTPANQAFVVQSVSDHRITTNELRYGHCNP